ncbi:hypothetical protein C6Y13_00935 [Lactiplantibacillus pentosus]|uniref:hypothetical protein n=1 Tax=Lactiplantibacillus pentosus TaxID=1589 RepID=UPI000D013D0D|nr:hypothetical protein [Lactiplantibacillus pentosus]PRO92852.1 hypothetical protein C6Y13_00935 [Lactiplantibacillus pentosus]
MDIDEQLQRAEERVKALKKRKADMKLKNENAALRAELQDLKSRINSIEKLRKFNVDFSGNNDEKVTTKVVKFDDVISALKR